LTILIQFVYHGSLCHTELCIMGAYVILNYAPVDKNVVLYAITF